MAYLGTLCYAVALADHFIVGWHNSVLGWVVVGSIFFLFQLLFISKVPDDDEKKE